MRTSDISVEYVNHMGSDNSVADAARVSFDKLAENYTPEQNAKLIQYLAKHKHYSPFNHTFLTVRVKAPIFTARQLVKHEYLPWNEVSRRYVDDEIEVYMPPFWRGRADNVKQGSSTDEVKVNTYGTGICIKCGADVPRKTAGPRGKWCSERCRASYRKEHDPDFRIHTAKYNAEKRGIPFDLKRGDVEWVTHCPILGVELDYTSTNDTTDTAPSIDRIDSSKGYEKDNVWVISNKANRMKNDASQAELIQFARKILLHFNGQVVPESSSIEHSIQHAVDTYHKLLDLGVCPEQARMVLPQNMMTTWIWSGTLKAFHKMLSLRLDSHTQYETRIVAEKILPIIEQHFPISIKALLNESE